MWLVPRSIAYYVRVTDNSKWNFADLWEVIADQLPGATALVHGDRRYTWSQMDRRADGLAATLVGSGLTYQSKVAQYLYNRPEYMESVFGTLKAGMVPVNTNYRYMKDELIYLWDNADTEAVVFEGSFAEGIEPIRSKLPNVKIWLFVDDGSGPCPEWATPYEEAVTSAREGRFTAPWERTGDDLYLLYTGGTTGYPKGVMWRQDDLFMRVLGGLSLAPFSLTGGMDGVRRALKGPGISLLPACPLMHGTGAFTALGIMSMAGSIVTLTKRSFDAAELLETVTREKINALSIVGDAFAKPIVAELEAHPDRYTIASVVSIISSGVMWSEQTKEALLDRNPNMLLVDVFSSSEAVGMGMSISSGVTAANTGKFTLGEGVRVLDPDTLEEVAPGSDTSGIVALPGRNPIGYYKDERKTAATFRLIGGVSYVIPGDFATIGADGTIHLLGRGSECINTGGEKVFPEEVEEVIKAHDGVRDAVVVGIPDDKFGEAITAVVELQSASQVTAHELIDHVKANLAGYKAPKRVRFVDTIGRAPNGKVDYARHRQEAIAWAAAL